MYVYTYLYIHRKKEKETPEALKGATGKNICIYITFWKNLYPIGQYKTPMIGTRIRNR